MKHVPGFALLLGELLWSSLIADTIQFRDGTSIEGKLIRETPTSYVIEVPFSKTIKEERIIPIEQVSKIIPTATDQLDFEKIETLIPVPDMQDLDGYKRRMADVQAFINDHSESSHVDAAKKMLEVLSSEAAQIEDGGIKFAGRVIPSAEYQSNQLEVDSRIAASGIQRQIQGGQLLQALRKFQSFHEDFHSTKAHADILQLVLLAIRSHLAETEAMLTAHDKRMADRAAFIQRQPIDERRDTEAAIALENQGLEARLKAEKKAGINWVTVDPYCKPALQETLNHGRREIERLNQLKNAPSNDVGAMYREIINLIRVGGSKQEINDKITAARSAGMPARYLSRLEPAAR